MGSVLVFLNFESVFGLGEAW